MAKDLGKLNININADESGIKKSFSEGGEEASRKLGESVKQLMSSIGGSAGSSIASALSLPARAIMSRIGSVSQQRLTSPAGGGAPTKFTPSTVGGKAGGGAPTKFTPSTVGGKTVTSGASRGVMLALKAAGVIAAFAAVAFVAKKVATTLYNWGEQVSNVGRQLAGLNASLAQNAAEMSVRSIMRRIRTAQNIAPFAIETSRAMEDLKDAIQPVKDLFFAMKSILATNFARGMIRLIQQLTAPLQILTVLIMSINALLKVTRGLLSAINPVNWIKWVWNKIFGDGSAENPLTSGVKDLVTLLIEQTKALEEIRQQMRNLSDDQLAENINKYLGSVGVGLTAGKWDPWAVPQP